MDNLREKTLSSIVFHSCFICAGHTFSTTDFSPLYRSNTLQEGNELSVVPMGECAYCFSISVLASLMAYIAKLLSDLFFTIVGAIWRPPHGSLLIMPIFEGFTTAEQ